MVACGTRRTGSAAPRPMAAVTAERALEVEHQPAPIRQAGEAVGERLGARGAQQLGVVAERDAGARDRHHQGRRGQQRGAVGERHEVVVGEQRERDDRERAGIEERLGAVAVARRRRAPRLPRGPAAAGQRRRPQHVHERPVAVAADGVLVEVDRVRDRGQRDAEAEQRPTTARAPRLRRERDQHEADEHEVPERVGEVDRDLRGVAVRRRDDRVEGERDDQGGGGERRQQPVDPHACRDALAALGEQQRDARDAQRIEGEVEPFGDRAVPAGRQRDPRDVAGGPAGEAGRDAPPRAAVVGPGERAPGAQQHADQLHADVDVVGEDVLGRGPADPGQRVREQGRERDGGQREEKPSRERPWRCHLRTAPVSRSTLYRRSRAPT